MLKWKKATFNRAMTRAEDPAETTGYVASAFGISKTGWGTWRVTHLPSGLALSAIDGPSLARTKRICAELSKLDWSATDMNAIAKANGLGGAHYLADHLRQVLEADA